ncbi:alkaline phosphatase family protein [Pseudarthrobacter sp. J1738]|uniref:alkaline phosphatase family protein n=1 Tax=Pseudarthrobacter sp. J1738 TaxID=3420446 RepID=UPI003D2B7069
MADPTAHYELPKPPAYGKQSIAEVLESGAASIGLPGFSNKLNLPPAQRVCVVLADGLGRSMLKAKGAHTPFIRAALAAGQGSVPTWLDAAFPTTTAASLASLGTAKEPGKHGMVGYDVLDPQLGRVVNMLGNWDADVDPTTWQPEATVFERASQHTEVVTVSLPQFADSAMTKAALRGSKFIGRGNSHARTQAAAEAMASSPNMLMYFYTNELDKAGHRHGWRSEQWEVQLEELDHTIKRLATTLPSGTTILLTGDHGMVDVPESQRIDFSAEPELIRGVRYTAGEPRMVHLYLEPELDPAAAEALLGTWRTRFGEKIWAFTRQQAITAGLFGLVQPRVIPRIGDIMIAAREELALYDTRRVRPSAMDVVGQHGSLTKAEREVPLVMFTATGNPKTSPKRSHTSKR